MAAPNVPSETWQKAMPMVKLPSPMTRKGLGSLGGRAEVLYNHFAVHYSGSDSVYHYVVSMSTAVAWPATAASRGEGITNKTVCRSVMKKLYEGYGLQKLGGKKFAYDGEKSLFSPRQFKFETQEFSVILEDGPTDNTTKIIPFTI